MIFEQSYPKEYQLTPEAKNVLEALNSYEDIRLEEVEDYYIDGKDGGLKKKTPEKQLVRALEDYGKLLIKTGVYV